MRMISWIAFFIFRIERYEVCGQTGVDDTTKTFSCIIVHL